MATTRVVEVWVGRASRGGVAVGIMIVPAKQLSAAIAQLGERQTEDLKVPGSIPGLGMFYESLWEKEGNSSWLLAACVETLTRKPATGSSRTG